MELTQADVDERWHLYEQLAGVEREAPGVAEAAGPVEQEEAAL
jgi:hypothetical protein